eukprot:4028616-Prymnesium_polylepis.1
MRPTSVAERPTDCAYAGSTGMMTPMPSCVISDALNRMPSCILSSVVRTSGCASAAGGAGSALGAAGSGLREAAQRCRAWQRGGSRHGGGGNAYAQHERPGRRRRSAACIVDSEGAELIGATYS